MIRRPPKPKLALSIGVIGHRPNRLAPAARHTIFARIATFLDTLVRELEAAQQAHADFFAPEPPRLSILCALAEGADRIAAKTALDKGLALEVPLPFPEEVYATDFKTAESLDEFRKLLGDARSVLMLPGERAAEARAYEAAGLTVLSQSDIVLAIWDGGPSGGRGGTTDMLAAAAKMGIPIVHIDATGGAPTVVRWAGLENRSIPPETIQDITPVEVNTALPSVIAKLVQPPTAEVELRALRDYLEQGTRAYNFRAEFPLLLAALGINSTKKEDVFPWAPEVLAAHYRTLARPASAGDISTLAEAYAWADAIAVRYAQVFRSAFTMNFLLGALAVVFAAGSIFGEANFPEANFLIVFEIVFITLVLVNTTVGRRRRWHQRWLEAREVAERLRVSLPLWVLALRPATFFSGEEPTWTGWYARACVRAQGLRSGTLNQEGLEGARKVMLDLLTNQNIYHRDTERRMHQLEHRLEQIGFRLFIATLGAAGFHLISSLIARWGLWSVAAHWSHLFDKLVAVLTAALPALATAAYGTRVIGDFDGIAKRSARTGSKLERLIHSIERDSLDFETLRSRARTAADAMLGDVASWRLAAESRPLAIPG